MNRIKSIQKINKTSVSASKFLNNFFRNLDSLHMKLLPIVGVIVPLFTIGQIIVVYSNKSVEGMSLLTWGGYFISNILWLRESFKLKSKSFIINQVLFFIVYSILFVGFMLYI